MALTLDGTNGIVSSGSITTQSATGVIFSDSSSLPAASSPFSLKNRIINGDMVISQRNGSNAVTTPDVYTVDRWIQYAGGGGVISWQQSSTAPTGFNYSLSATVTTPDTSLGTSDYYFLRQFIEGYNVADLDYGTANAKTVTLSFWVRSSLTGTFGGSLTNSGGSRSYIFSYTISAANTWEYKTITIAGDTSGTWNKTNGGGLAVQFALGFGTDWTQAAGSWVASEKYTVPGATNVVSTNGATWYVTGVQLERNTTATPFEWLPYSTELALCQRYFEKMTGAANVAYSSGCATFANQPRTLVFYKTQKRAVPTFSSSAASEFRFQYDSSNSTPSAITTASLGIDTAFLNATGISIVENKPCILISNSTSSYLEFSAEL